MTEKKAECRGSSVITPEPYQWESDPGRNPAEGCNRLFNEIDRTEETYRAKLQTQTVARVMKEEMQRKLDATRAA